MRVNAQLHNEVRYPAVYSLSWSLRILCIRLEEQIPFGWISYLDFSVRPEIITWRAV
jgi:hypothetical protein